MPPHTRRRLRGRRRPTVFAFILLVSLALSLSGCDRQLEENPSSEIAPEDFFNTPEQFRAAANGVYAQLRGIDNFNTAEAAQHSTDAIMVPTRGPNWGDGGIWRELTRHTWTASHPDVNGSWVDMYAGVARANTVLGALNRSEGHLTEAQRADFGTEVRFLRAYFYYWLMDFFGGVPIVVEEGNEMYDFPHAPVGTNPPPHHNRKQVYDFLLQELTGCTSDTFDNSCVNNPDDSSVLANLRPKGSDEIQYGQATTGAGYAFLARLLINSQVYGVAIGGDGPASPSDVGSGPAFYDEALTAANAVINGADPNGSNRPPPIGTYSLADNYFDNFAADNPTSPEIIFAVPYKSGNAEQGAFWRFKQSPHHNLPNPGGPPWNGFTTIAEFYESYATAPGPDAKMGTQDDVHNDTRAKSFLAGQMYRAPSVGCAGDECFSDETAGKVFVGSEETIPLFHTIEVPEIKLGDLDSARAVDEFGFPSGKRIFRLEAPGLRPMKFEIDANANNEFFGNDYPLFRLAEMYLIRAEAQAKTGRGDPIATLNTLRSKRARDGADLSLSGSDGDVMNLIMRERGHELLQEFTRRPDLIRYEFAHGGSPSGYEQAPDPSGVYSPTFTGPWLFKEGSENYRVLFPIPEGQLSTNPNLQQNPGYNRP